jgi:hypothetical protein
MIKETVSKRASGGHHPMTVGTIKISNRNCIVLLLAQAVNLDMSSRVSIMLSKQIFWGSRPGGSVGLKTTAIRQKVNIEIKLLSLFKYE